MALFNAKIDFVGSGQIRAGVDTILFEDTYIDGVLRLAEAGHSGLDTRFVNNSILGALNELLDGLITTSGNVGASVLCYTESVDTPAFVHTLQHDLGTVDLMVQMFDSDPVGGDATNVLMCFTPVDNNNVRIELDAATSGHFVVFGCPGS